MVYNGATHSETQTVDTLWLHGFSHSAATFRWVPMNWWWVWPMKRRHATLPQLSRGLALLFRITIPRCAVRGSYNNGLSCPWVRLTTSFDPGSTHFWSSLPLMHPKMLTSFRSLWQAQEQSGSGPHMGWSSKQQTYGSISATSTNHFYGFWWEVFRLSVYIFLMCCRVYGALGDARFGRKTRELGRFEGTLWGVTTNMIPNWLICLGQVTQPPWVGSSTYTICCWKVCRQHTQDDHPSVCLWYPTLLSCDPTSTRRMRQDPHCPMVQKEDPGVIALIEFEGYPDFHWNHYFFFPTGFSSRIWILGFQPGEMKVRASRLSDSKHTRKTVRLEGPRGHGLGNFWKEMGCMYIYIKNLCKWDIHDIYMIYKWYINDIYMIYKWYIHDMYMIYTWYLHDIYMIYIHDIYMIYTWYIHDIYIHMIYI